MSQPRSRPGAARRPAAPPEPPERQVQPQSQPFDLDALERDGDPGEFWFTHAGADYLLADPYGVDWQESESLNQLLEARDTQGIMRRMLGERYDEFAAVPLAAWKLDKLADAWMVHYGLGEKQRLAVLIDRYGGDLAADFADRGQDLPELWRARRYAYCLAIIDRLPRDSHFVAAVADDDEIATGEPVKSVPPSLTEFGPEVERLTGIYDLLALLLAVQTTQPGKKPRLPRPLQRPVTAAQRARERAAESDRQYLASMLFPGRR